MSERLATGIPELDLVLGGGLQPGSVVILAGAPGTGKTILAQQICFAVATPDRKAVYYTTLSEPHSKLVQHMSGFAFFDPTALGARIDFIHLGDMLSPVGGTGLRHLVDEVVRVSLESGPAVVVIDSTKALGDFATRLELRTALYELTSRIGHTQTVLLLLGEYLPSEIREGSEFSLVDGILEMAYEPREPVDRRWLRVVKMRASAHLVGKHSFRIGAADGITIYPRLETVAPGPAADLEARIAGGVPGLDVLMGGGMAAGEATVVQGPSGVGKTIVGLQFIVQGLTEGERCLYVSFQESASQLAQKAHAFGWSLDSALDEGRLVVHHVPVGELDLDALGATVRRVLADGSIRRVVIDSLAELVFAARESERFPAYTRSLVGFIRAAGASAIVTSETRTLGPMAEAAGDFSFLFHNVVLLRYLEMDSRTGRGLSVLKMRNSVHASGVHLFDVTSQGVVVMEALEGVTGMLGWSVLRSPAEMH